MPFKKKHVPWNKGKTGVYSPEFIKHLSESRRSPVSTEMIIELYKTGLSCSAVAEKLGTSASVVQRRVYPTGLLRDKGAGARGKKWGQERRTLLSNALKAKLSDPVYLQEHRIGSNNPFFGHKHKPETIEAMKAKLRGMMAGDKNPQWKGGKSLEPYGYRFKRIIRHRVYVRDGYTCQNCGVCHNPKSGLLVAHHKDENKDNCELSNLVTLCRPCHGRITMGARWGKEVVNPI